MKIARGDATKLSLAEQEKKPMIRSGATIYRIHEITHVYGVILKALIHEEFGGGIMSAINFDVDIGRVENPKGDRVKITYEGKLFPHEW